VIGKADHFQTTAFGLTQDVDIAFVGLFVIVRTGGMQMQIDAGPIFGRGLIVRWDDNGFSRCRF
jgi:hypothetical protein